ncbi:hypothetical protein [Saccharothrix obliqua]|uniref:hypothetical protein n=1 Tax=Saccharothrix obliqua TaxID=2861747 RepID=UPI001C5EF891|nr:hypothetical protein [Saccharothrix obliqua]MBW4722426.1 hypothetical protein [Saccharothrix obliqua]
MLLVVAVAVTASVVWWFTRQPTKDLAETRPSGDRSATTSPSSTPSSGPTNASPSGSGSPSLTSSAAVGSLPTSAPKAQPVAAMTFDLTVPTPGCGASAGVDVHLDDLPRSVPGEKESPQADLEYDDCGGNIYPGSAGSVGLFTAGTTPTKQECEAAALRNSIGSERSIHTMKVGDVLCVVTDEKRVAAAVIAALGAPWGPPEDKPQPTISLQVTRWEAG